MRALRSIVTAPFRLVAWLVATLVALIAGVVTGLSRATAAIVAGLVRLALLPVRWALALVVLTARGSARAVGGSARLAAVASVGSARTAAGVGRAAVRSSLVAFVLGAALGGFLASPTGRRLLDELGGWVRDRRPPVSDEELAERVRSELRGSPRTWHLEPPEIDVRDGVVSLRGEAAHPTARTDLEAAVSSVDGVVAVDNRLTVAGTPT